MYSPLNQQQLARYFQRIGFAGEARADLPTLQALHALHPRRIPFENLDSWLGRVPSLEQDAVFDKLVVMGRGGYCFEHNQLFMRVLLGLGFQVQALAGRVLILPDAQPRTHKVLLVDIGGQAYLADVAFGGFTAPAALQLDAAVVQATSHERQRLDIHDDRYVLSAEIEGNWLEKYSFGLEPQTAADYEMANWFVASHPRSIFVNDLIAARVDEDGRHALMNTQYTRHRLGQESQHIDVDNPQALLQLLREQFHINTDNIEGLERKLDFLCWQAKNGAAPQADAA